MFSPTTKDITGTIEMLRALNSLPRWSAHIQHGYTEIAKLGLNCQIAAILFELVNHEGHDVHFEYLPRIAIYRAFEKFEKCDILDETYQELFNGHQKLKIEFEKYMKQKTIAMTSIEFYQHISDLEETFEMRIYKAATAIATYIEAQEIKRLIPDIKYSEIISLQEARLQKYKEFPIVNELLNGSEKNANSEYSGLNKLFKELSSLRNRLRWVKLAPIINYSVLGHSFDVAVLNYLISLAENSAELKLAEKGFYVGLYHDLAEAWTGNMPSPLKDSIPGLRKRTEEIEIDVLNKKVFVLLPKWLIPKFKNVMLELLPESQKRYYKSGDTLAAIIEASTQIIAGSNNRYFYEVIIKSLVNSANSPILYAVIRKLAKDANISNIQILKYKLSRKRF